MKALFYIGILFIIPLNIIAQKKCNCPRVGEDIYDCKPVKLKSGSKLYWNYNCDSTWLTFENRYRKKNILDSSGFIDL
jgi:hypothetical protein